MALVNADLGINDIFQRKTSKDFNPEPGIYFPGHWSLGYDMTNLKNEYANDIGPPEEPMLPCFGVVDNVEQWKRLAEAATLYSSSRKFCVAFVRIRKADEAPGGWRWHKWGPYLGNRAPQCEYLYDEPEIDEVLTFHIYELT